MNGNFNRWVGMRSLGVLTCAGLAVSGWAMDQPKTTAQGQANKTRANQDSSYQTQGKPNSGGQSSDVQPSGAQSSSNRSKGSTDQRVVDLLNTVNQAEIDEGKWMQDHAQSQAVKDYAKMLVSDHQSAAESLKEVSNKANLTPATDAAVQQESMQLKSRLSTTPGRRAIASICAPRCKITPRWCANCGTWRPASPTPS